MFWKEDGAKFLICTSAGGEGINLQAGRILFNYDLPWNPMAVEQRIGRIHRYGQQETVQAYNLIARDTVEERIYDLLELKLEQIARTIGKIDRRRTNRWKIFVPRYSACSALRQITKHST
jgi:SNF2 family DNA or RNA helicase